MTGGWPGEGGGDWQLAPHIPAGMNRCGKSLADRWLSVIIFDELKCSACPGESYFIIDEWYCIFPLPYSPPSSHFNPFVCVHVSRLLFRSLSVSSVQFNCSVVSNSLQLHGLQHARSPCPSPTPRVYSNYCPLSWWYHPTILSSVVPFSSCLLSFPRVFSKNTALLIRWPKYWSFSFSISPSNEHSGLTSFRMGWLDLLTVQGTLKSLLQPHSSKASILWHSAFFMVQFSHP